MRHFARKSAWVSRPGGGCAGMRALMDRHTHATTPTARFNREGQLFILMRLLPVGRSRRETSDECDTPHLDRFLNLDLPVLSWPAS